MKLVTVEAVFPDAEKAVALFEARAHAVRAMEGCESYAIYRAPSGGEVVIVQRWSTAEAFNTYRSSDAFGQLGQTLKPMMTAPPITTVAEIEG